MPSGPQWTESTPWAGTCTPRWLAFAHEKLDRAALAAYGWPEGLGDEEVLERLLALNLERAATQGSLGVPETGTALDPQSADAEQG